jgi:hypothetical protein
MELSSQMLLFARVVESESFSAAARALNHSPSAVSRQIGHLEDRLGVRLVNRSKQGLSLTVEGRAFYERCSEVAARISDAEAYVVSMGAHPQGELARRRHRGLRQGAGAADPAGIPGAEPGSAFVDRADRPADRSRGGEHRPCHPLHRADRRQLGDRPQARQQPPRHLRLARLRGALRQAPSARRTSPTTTACACRPSPVERLAPRRARRRRPDPAQGQLRGQQRRRHLSRHAGRRRDRAAVELSGRRGHQAGRLVRLLPDPCLRPAPLR